MNTPVPVLRRVALAALAVGLSVGALGACSDDDGDGDAGSADGTAEVGGATSITSAPEGDGSSTTDATSTTTDEPYLIGSEEPATAAGQIYGAWKSDDKDNAKVVAEPAAIDALWAVPAGDYTPYRGCDTGEFDTSGCLFRGDPGTIQFELEQRNDRWIVTSVVFSPA